MAGRGGTPLLPCVLSGAGPLCNVLLHPGHSPPPTWHPCTITPFTSDSVEIKLGWLLVITRVSLHTEDYILAYCMSLADRVVQYNGPVQLLEYGVNP